MLNLDAAREAFKRGEYAEALELDDKAIRLMPGDAALHEFRGLTLFALKRYGAAAAAIHAVLATGPGWDWPTVSGLYAGPVTYTEHLRGLEAYQRANPDDPDAAFLLAYHDLVAGRPEAAAEQLARVVKLEPRDVLSARLLQSLRVKAPDGGAPRP
jgi:thioredoxin-like negative regulator of GroEL